MRVHTFSVRHIKDNMLEPDCDSYFISRSVDFISYHYSTLSDASVHHYKKETRSVESAVNTLTKEAN